ncbi:MAG: hypothetical protein ACI8QZ_002065 [Chlamydiales bacterium]|jgi:hypothetical protein
MKWIIYLGLGALWAPLQSSFGQQLEAHWKLNEGRGATVAGPVWAADLRAGGAFVRNEYTVDQGAVLSGDVTSGVLGDTFNVLLARDVSHGTLALGADGSFTYTPNMGFYGEDQFAYRSGYGMLTSSPVVIALTVRPSANIPPRAVDDIYVVQGDGNVMVDAVAGVLANDLDPNGDVLTAQLSSDVANGVLALASDGSFMYTPDLGFVGFDSFDYRASDGSATSNLATATLTVTGVPADELMGHWRMDTGTGLVAVDWSGLGHDGILEGPGWSTDTADSSPFSLSFDGVDDRVSIGNLDLPGEALTLACWLQPSGFLTPDARLITKAGGAQANDHYWMLSTVLREGVPTLRFRLKTDEFTTTLVAASGSLSAGVWSHAVATYDGSFMRIYLDGVEVASTSKSGSLSVNPGFMAAIGNQPAGAGAQPFAGLIDDVRVYTRALDDAEIGILIGNGGPVAQVQFQSDGQLIPEADPARPITVTLSRTSLDDISVPFTITGSADPADYSLSASPLVILAGQLSADIVLTPVDDALIEPSETVVLTLGAPSSSVLGAMTVHTATLVDDDAPLVPIESDDFNDCSLSSVWTLTDTAGDATLLTRGPGTDDAQLVLSVPAGVHNPFNTLGVPHVTQPVPNTDFELEVKFDSVLTDALQDQGILVLQDTLNWLRFDFYRDAGSLFLFAGSTAAGSTSIEFNGSLGALMAPTWMRISRVGDQWTVAWSTDGSSFNSMVSFDHPLVAQSAGVFVGNSGAAHTGIFDYFFDTSAPVVPEDGPVVGATGRTLSVATTGMGSVLADPILAAYYCSETVSLEAIPAGGWRFDHWEGALGGDANPETLTMGVDRSVSAVFVPDNVLPDVNFSLATQDVSEGASPVSIDLVLSAMSAVDVTVPYTLTGTASAGTDYTAGPQPVVITAGQLAASISLSALADGVDEPSETVVITLGAPTNANQTGLGVHTATLLDIDPPSIEFTSASQMAGEGGGATMIGLVLSSTSPVDVSVAFTLSGSATSLVDYDIDASPLVILAGQSAASISLVPVDDGMPESDETVIVTLGMPMGVTLGATAVHTATLVDDDSPPEVDFASAGQSVGEETGMTTVTVQLSHPTTVAVSVPFVLSGSATAPDDYTASSSPLEIAAGQVSADIILTLVDDALVEGPESVVLTMGSPSGGVQGSVLVHSATILDDDLPGAQSDDFSSANLRPDLWSFVDPLGDGTLQIVGNGTLDAQLHLSVPEGTAHEAWTPLNVPRVMQAVPDTDLDVVAKFESELTTAFQNDGLVFDQEDGANWVRFDFRQNGTHLQAYASSTVDNGPATVLTTNIAAGPWNNPMPLFMRVTRTGDSWLYRYSFDGSAWITVGSFDRSLQLNSFGPFCGNGGALRPTHTTVVDYVFNQLAPIPMEDMATPADSTAPLVYRSQARTLNDTAIEVTWETDEPALGSLEYGLTDAFELGFWGTSAPAAYAHTFVVTGLTPEVEYHFRINSEDASMNLTTPPELLATTFPFGFTEGPSIQFWYGQEIGGVNHQRFGHLGEPQAWINVLGNVFDFNGSVASLSYRIGAGGAPRALSRGPEVPWTGSYRLELPGDFNADIAPMDLMPGMNEVFFTAIDDEGNETVEICQIDYTAGVAWPQTYSVDWKIVIDIQDVAQVVDGQWTIEPDPHHAGESVLRSPVPGYDRMIAFGDPNWENYEALIPFTANAFSAAGFHPATNSFALGLILRWPGHSGPEIQQPRTGFFPFGGLFAYRWFEMMERWDHYGTSFTPTIGSIQHPITIGVPSFIRTRVQTLMDGSRLYQLRHWQEGETEPTDWIFESTHLPFTGTDDGALVLISNYVDASFGNITITPL